MAILKIESSVRPSQFRLISTNRCESGRSTVQRIAAVSAIQLAARMLEVYLGMARFRNDQ
jgi:hypothetical protein